MDSITVAYADPPYPGCAHYYPENREVDHAELIGRLDNDYPDGWALSTRSTALQQLLALCPSDVRIAAWVKPLCSFKPNVNPAYAWEPVIWKGGRTAKERGGRDVWTLRDWVSANITLQKGVVGAKPAEFCRWLFNLLGLRPGDTFVDLYPGTGFVSEMWEDWCRQGRIEY